MEVPIKPGFLTKSTDFTDYRFDNAPWTEARRPKAQGEKGGG
jgi:hypothetical protein